MLLLSNFKLNHLIFLVNIPRFSFYIIPGCISFRHSSFGTLYIFEFFILILSYHVFQCVYSFLVSAHFPRLAFGNSPHICFAKQLSDINRLSSCFSLVTCWIAFINHMVNFKFLLFLYILLLYILPVFFNFHHHSMVIARCSYDDLIWMISIFQ